VSLTGLPLIALAVLVTAVVAVLAGWGWARIGVAGRFAGVLLLEALTVATAGLIVNRHEQFYPSWQALRGDTGTVVTTAPVHAGLLDDHLPPGPFAWRPRELASWHLAAPPTVRLPAGYRDRPGVTFPVVLAFGTAAPRTPSAVTVTVAPTSHTTAAALRTLPPALRHDLRVTATGWDVIGGGALGNELVQARVATRFRSPTDLPPALAAPLRLPAS
jgi:lysyl-tRNA synthetase class 2